MNNKATLYFMCGKMAAGKTTYAKDLAARKGAVLFVQDELLLALYPGEIVELPDYARCWTRLTNALTPIVCALLSKGISVVLDFPANTTAQRAWFRTMIEQAGVEHEMHYVDAPDELCKQQLRERSKQLPPASPWTTEAEFDAVTAYFRPPSEEEGFNVIRYERT